MFRRYDISIEVTASAIHLNGIEKQLGCSISEPSNWVEYGGAKERGLTFLDKEGKELTSAVFMHQPIFQPLSDKDDTDITEYAPVKMTTLRRKKL